MKLYYHPLSTYSQKVLLAGYETGLNFDLHLVDLFDEASRTAYRQIYPIGKVPLLILDDGHPIPESSIIVEYLHSLRPDAALLPSDPTESRKTRFLDRVYDLYLANQVGALFFELRKPADQQDQHLMEDAKQKISATYDYMERNLEGKTWQRGERFTLADCAAGPPLFYAQDLAPFDSRPNILAFWERFQNRESYQKILAQATPLLKAT